MGYERDYRRGNRAPFQGYDRDRYSRQPTDYDQDDRGFFDRAGDEVRSWFGDEEAERRRRYDERYEGASDNRSSNERYASGRGGLRSGGYASGGDYGDYRPSTGYGSASMAAGSGFGASPGGYTGRGYSGPGYGRSENDYSEWRNRQIDALDRDYDDYRREKQQRFDDDFGTWRTRRQSQRTSLNQVSEHMEVVGSDAQHIGTVDKVRGDRIILTKSDQAAGGRHHSIPCSCIEQVDDKVTISKTAEEAKQAWRDEERRGALFGDRDHDGDGPHVLNRSFSGTY